MCHLNIIYIILKNIVDYHNLLNCIYLHIYYFDKQNLLNIHYLKYIMVLVVGEVVVVGYIVVGVDVEVGVGVVVVEDYDEHESYQQSVGLS